MCHPRWRHHGAGKSGSAWAAHHADVQISDFLRQLFPFIPKDRISTLSCAHVIPKANLLTQVVSCGPRKVDFEFKFANRGDESLVSSILHACIAAHL